MRRQIRGLLALLVLLPAALQAAIQDITVTEMVLRSIRANANRTAFQRRVGEGQWEDITYAQWLARSEKVAAWLLSKGFQKGEKVGILDYNNPEWPVVDLGVQLAGGVLVPFYPTLTGPQHNFLLDETEMRFFFIMDETHLAPLRQLPGALDGIQVVGLYPPERWPHASKTKLAEAGASEPHKDWGPGVTLLDDIEAGTEVADAQRAAIRERISQVKPDDLFTICYTSGTTSAPPPPGAIKVRPGKGVMLSHRNIASNVQGTLASVEMSADDIFLSVLPLAHMFERTGGYYIAVTAGSTIAYARSPQTFTEDVAEVRPTVFACVPLLFERMYNKAFQMASKGALGKALKAARGTVDFFGGNGKAFKERILGKVLKKKLGGRVRFAVSGGAALKKDLAMFFEENVGITILEGYGLTETSPVLTCNRPETYAYGTVGVPIPQVQIKLADSGEILAKGPNTMMGYLNLPEKTAEAFDADGWFKTGDRGAYDINGMLKIIGRTKLIFKLKNGKYISPETIEKALVNELVAQSMVVGENQDFAAALIFPDFLSLKSHADGLGVSGTKEELCQHPEIIALYQRLADVGQQGLAKYQKIKKFKLMPHVLTVEDGQLTPTMKLKRGVVAAQFADDITGLFE